MNGRFSPGAAIVGVVFITFGVLFMLDQLDVFELKAVLVLPILLIGLGLGLLLGVREPARRRSNQDDRSAA